MTKLMLMASITLFTQLAMAGDVFGCFGGANQSFYFKISDASAVVENYRFEGELTKSDAFSKVTGEIQLARDGVKNSLGWNSGGGPVAFKISMQTLDKAELTAAYKNNDDVFIQPYLNISRTQSTLHIEQMGEDHIYFCTETFRSAIPKDAVEIKVKHLQ